MSSVTFLSPSTPPLNSGQRYHYTPLPANVTSPTSTPSTPVKTQRTVGANFARLAEMSERNPRAIAVLRAAKQEVHATVQDSQGNNVSNLDAKTSWNSVTLFFSKIISWIKDGAANKLIKADLINYIQAKIGGRSDDSLANLERLVNPSSRWPLDLRIVKQLIDSVAGQSAVASGESRNSPSVTAEGEEGGLDSDDDVSVDLNSAFNAVATDDSYAAQADRTANKKLYSKVVSEIEKRGKQNDKGDLNQDANVTDLSSALNVAADTDTHTDVAGLGTGHHEELPEAEVAVSAFNEGDVASNTIEIAQQTPKKDQEAQKLTLTTPEYQKIIRDAIRQEPALVASTEQDVALNTSSSNSSGWGWIKNIFSSKNPSEANTVEGDHKAPKKREYVGAVSNIMFASGVFTVNKNKPTVRLNSPEVRRFMQKIKDPTVNNFNPNWNASKNVWNVKTRN